MSAMTSATNPTSTGGGGTYFEQHVDALFLALLLVRAPLPILRDCQAEEVHLQAEHLGWKTDDVLIIAKNSAGEFYRLASQVKRQFRISEHDEACRKAFADFWGDFNREDFEPEFDRFALITLRGTNALLGDFQSLLDCSRASADVEDFMHRLGIDGFLSKTARNRASKIRQILEECGPTPTDQEFWTFLRTIHVLSFDLNTASAQNEVWAKALLASAVKEGNAVEKAEATWRELLELTAAGMPTAASYKYSDLPKSIRVRHAPIETQASQVIRSLSEHSSITLDGIKTTIGGIAEISREVITSQVLGALNESQIVVVSAPAGLGKSAVAKASLESLAKEMYCIAFRAEEFTCSHIDVSLQRAQIPVNGTELLGILSGQSRKLIFVDSIERLLEASVRDAFSDILNLARKDQSVRFLITCRDYSLATVRSALLEQAGLTCKVLEVPPLSDEELSQAVSVLPQLEIPLRSEAFKRLLRSPYLLDKAAVMNWSNTAAQPTNEQAFRKRCWDELIRRNSEAADGMPERRERVFEEVALRRARQLRPFVEVSDLDAAALAALQADGLLGNPPKVGSMAAPGHDVLEDWAIIHWINRRWLHHEQNAMALSLDIGEFPAVRRAYRKWLGELLRTQRAEATDYVFSVFCNLELPSFFRDDTVICAMQSPSSQTFLERHRESLLHNECNLLVRVIHLIRVACKDPPWWLPKVIQVPSELLVPSGDAWAAVLEIIHDNVDLLLPEQVPTVLGMIEDFSKLVDQYTLEPEGYRHAAKIGFQLLIHLDGYRMAEYRRRVLIVIAKMPRGDEVQVKNLLSEATSQGDKRGAPGEFAAILLEGVDGWNVARFFPSEVTQLANSVLRIQLDSGNQRHRRFRDPSDIEPCFGLVEHSDFRFFPPSAIRGIFLPLLRHHRKEGLSFTLEFINHAGDWYGNRRWHASRLEPADEIEIRLPDGRVVRQWGNSRLWNLYRGHSVGPHVLETALMALEAWLLELSEDESEDMESLLIRIIEASNNVMPTAVVASVCNAHPHKAGRVGVSLLTSPEIIAMDRERVIHEQTRLGMSMFPGSATNHLFEEERRKSSELSHRGDDLEALAVRLQFGGLRDQVIAVLDSHREALSQEVAQSESGKLWRLALHRMDVRRFRVIDAGPSETLPSLNKVEPSGDKDEKRHVLLEPGDMEPDIQEMVEKNADVVEHQARYYRLLNWGNAAWQRRSPSNLDVDDWPTHLRLARRCESEGESAAHLRGGPGMVAAVCARDHWDEMQPEDRVWCINKLIGEVERDSAVEDEMVRHSRGGHYADRYAAFVLPSILLRDVPAPQASQVESAIAQALTHAVEEVVQHAAQGIGAAMGCKFNGFSRVCAAAIAWQARCIQARLEEEHAKPVVQQEFASKVAREVIPKVRRAIILGDPTLDLAEELDGLNLNAWPGVQAARMLFPIFGAAVNSELAVKFHKQVATSLVDSWSRETEGRDRRFRQDLEFMHDAFGHVARFALKLDQQQALSICQPFLSAVDDHPDKVKEFIQDLVIEADSGSPKDCFWSIWGAFSDKILTAPWIHGIDSEHGRGKDLVGAIFLKNYWNQNVRHWHRLEGHGSRVYDLAARFPGSPVVFDAYCCLLYKIGESCLPKAFVLLAESLASGRAATMLAGQNTVFVVESLLRRHVYAEPHRLKSDPSVRRAVLSLLDRLVEAGSSAAYRMRDDFVTPLS